MRSRPTFVLFLGLVLIFALRPGLAAGPAPAPDTTKPWTRWWWPGSAVDEAGLTRQL